MIASDDQRQALVAPSEVQAHASDGLRGDAAARVTRAHHLMDRADQLMTTAICDQVRSDGPWSLADEFNGLYLSALRASGAVLALHEKPSARTRSRSAWYRLRRVSAEMAGWADKFEPLSPLRVAVEAGTRDPSPRVVAQLHRDLETFFEVVVDEIDRFASLASSRGHNGGRSIGDLVS